jgi:hypothetical protein
MMDLRTQICVRTLLQPESSTSTAEFDVTGFLDMYPFVKRDQGYVDFLSHYGGALVGDEYDTISLGIYGFSDEFGPYLLEPPVIDDEGFFTFADLLVTIETEEGDEEEVGMAFSFDATGMRRWGVYRRFIDESDYWYAHTFVELLENIRERNGGLLEKKNELWDRDFFPRPKHALERRRGLLEQKIAA